MPTPRATRARDELGLKARLHGTPPDDVGLDVGSSIREGTGLWGWLWGPWRFSPAPRGHVHFVGKSPVLLFLGEMIKICFPSAKKGELCSWLSSRSLLGFVGPGDEKTMTHKDQTHNSHLLFVFYPPPHLFQGPLRLIRDRASQHLIQLIGSLLQDEGSEGSVPRLLDLTFD